MGETRSEDFGETRPEVLGETRPEVFGEREFPLDFSPTLLTFPHLHSELGLSLCLVILNIISSASSLWVFDHAVPSSDKGVFCLS